MRHKKAAFGLALLVLLLSAVLGATVLREPIASAATPFQNVIIGNTDAQPVPVKQVGGVTASTSDVDQRTAVRFGPKSVAGNTELIPRNAIPADKKFIITYLHIRGEILGGGGFVDGHCDTHLLTTLPGGGLRDAPWGGVPLDLNDNVLAGSESAFLPLNSGEGLGFFCVGKMPDGQNETAGFTVSVGGYFMPAS